MSEAPERRTEEVAIYTPESAIRSPRRLLREMWRGLVTGRELAWRLFVRDIKGRYRQSKLGLLWAFVPAVATGLVFVILQARRVLNIDSGAIPYPVFALIGTVLWAAFADSLQAPIKAVVKGKPMLSKIRFPWEALIVAAFWEVLFDVAIKLVVLAAILAYFGLLPSSSWLLFPLFLLQLILLGFVIGLLLAPLGIVYTDIQSAMTALLPFWFLLTPAVYPPIESYPLKLISVLNPVTPVLQSAREALVATPMTMPGAAIVVGLLSIAGLLAGWIMYRLSIPIAVERMSA